MDKIKKEFSEEHRKHISEALKGKPKSEAHKAKMAEAHIKCNVRPSYKYKQRPENWLEKHGYKKAIYDLWVTKNGKVARVKKYKGETWIQELEPKLSNAGYLQVGTTARKNGKRVGKAFNVHVLVALAYIGPRPRNYDVDHKNFKRDDNRLQNLQYLHRSENRKRFVRKAI